MAKRSSSKRRRSGKRAAPPIGQIARKSLQKVPVAAVIWGAVLLVYLAVLYWQVPDAVSAWLQRPLGLISAVLATVVYACATRPADPQDDLVTRVRRGQHLDFGKQLREERRGHHGRAVNLPLLGETTLRAIGGAIVFVVVAAWWFTPLAPVAVAERAIGDLSEPLTREITSLVLVCPDGRLPIAQPPVRPPEARRLAKLIPDSADSYTLALKAIAEGRYDEAQYLLAKAMAEGEGAPILIQVARAQAELYADRPAEAAVWYGNALGAKPNDPGLLCQTAAAWIHAGSPAKAQALLAQALRLARDGGEGAKLDLAVCLHLQAALYQLTGVRLDRAEEYNKQAQKLFAEQLGEGDPREAASLNNQSVLFALRGSFPGARSLNNWATDIWRRHDEKGPGVAVGLANRAMRQYLQGQYVEARQTCDAALVIRRNTADVRGAVVAMSETSSATVALALGAYAETTPAEMKSLVTALETTLGARHPSVAVAMNTVGESYKAESLYALAQTYHAQAVEILRESLGPRHAYLVPTLAALAEARLLLGRYDDAEKNCLEALGIAEKSLATDDPNVARCLELQARVRLAQGKPDEARPLLEKALAMEVASLGEAHPRVAETLGYLGSIEPDRRTSRTGIERYEKAIAIDEAAFGEQCRDHPSVARLLVGLARLHVQRGQYADAEPHLRRAMEIGNATLVPFHPALAETLEAEAEVLRHLDPPDAKKADRLDARAKEIRQQHAEENRREEG
ncbi:MAG: tetratricopeptide repeat protein [Planctomycetia bacterium]|nr:tetratricopeptide repeat protein [Planctomycetia bacterium]